MSLAIDAGKVTRVLLADGWHEVQPGTFEIDAYEFLDGEGVEACDEPLLRGGQDALVPAAGAMWTPRVSIIAEKIACPLTSVLAVGLK